MLKNDEGIACLILNYNDWKTSRQLATVMEKYDVISYVVIVDNCSTDDSFGKLKKISTDKIHVIKSEKNGGYGYGNNFGINYIHNNLQCKYALICNPDIEIAEECICSLKQTIEENERCVVTAPIQRMYSKDGKIVMPWRLGNKRESIFSMSIVFSKLLHIKLNYSEQEIKNKKIIYCDVMQGALLMADVDFMVGEGRYDEDIFLYNEEECLAQNVKKNNKESILVCNNYYLHHHSVSIDKSYKSLVAKKKLKLKSRMAYIDKYYDISKINRVLIALFFWYCIFEMYIYQFGFRRRK